MALTVPLPHALGPCQPCPCTGLDQLSLWVDKVGGSPLWALPRGTGRNSHSTAVRVSTFGLNTHSGHALEAMGALRRHAPGRMELAAEGPQILAFTRPAGCPTLEWDSRDTYENRIDVPVSIVPSAAEMSQPCPTLTR